MRILQFSLPSLMLLTSFPLTAMASELPVTVNRGTRNTAFIGVGTDTATTALAANRSYSCIVLNREYDMAVPKQFHVFNTTVIGPNAQPVVASAIGSMKPGIAVPSNLASSQDSLRLSLIAPLPGNYTFSFVNAQPGGTAVPATTVRCNDTTLYGGFNRFVANTVIVELTNDTEETINAFVTIVDTAGNTLVDNVTTSVDPEGRNDVIFNALPAETFGQVIVTYVGSLGALSAYIAEYDFIGQSLTLKRERPMDTTPVLP